MIYPRQIEPILLERVSHFPVVGITGARQAGKTTLAKTIQEKLQKTSLYLDLELPSDLAKLQSPELFLRENEDKTVIIDEVQRMPELFPLLRSLVDIKRVPGRFIILGSASPELLKQSSETLAGRISYLELSPFHCREYPANNFKTLWLRGGFPPALFAAGEAMAFQWLSDFVTTFIERDLPQFGLITPSQVLRRLLQMLTSIHSNLLNYSLLANSLGLTMPTVKRYFSYLENAYFLRILSPWYVNVSKRLVKTPKVYFIDSGVLHALTGISDFNQLLGHPIAGASWEGYVIQQIIANLPPNMHPFFYRTKDGSELDLVLVKGNEVKLAVEIKLTDHPSLTRGNRIAHTDLGKPPLFILTPGGGDYPLEENIRVSDLEHFWMYLEGME